MRSTRTAAKRVTKKSSQSDGKTDLAIKATAAITEAISRSTKAGFGKNADGKITVHVHIGDVIMMGFDEAIDAEEWGMRENNTEIIGGSARGKKATAADPEAQSDNNKKTLRKINFRKGNLELNATENSEPVFKKVVAKKAARSTLAKKSAKKTAKKR